jgi:tRNA U38,U39,U40 pseudouridine synthase TruA
VSAAQVLGAWLKPPSAKVEASQFWSAVDRLAPPATPEPAEGPDFRATMDLKRQWRIGTSPAILDELKAATKIYEGVHNFHNFTVGKEFNDRSAIRNMKSLKVGWAAHRVGLGLSLAVGLGAFHCWR